MAFNTIIRREPSLVNSFPIVLRYMTLIEQFNQAVTESKNLIEKPGTDTLLKLYAFYKQSTLGDVNIVLPSGSFDVVAKFKHDAWKELKGSSQESAMQHYIDLIAKLKR